MNTDNQKASEKAAEATWLRLAKAFRCDDKKPFVEEVSELIIRVHQPNYDAMESRVKELEGALNAALSGNVFDEITAKQVLAKSKGQG